jgi:cation diffusion facilitator CzcD-associated flavoprotein CzcO
MRNEGLMQERTTQPRICVIGAGAAGIAAAKELKLAGLTFDWFEQRERVGGLWVYSDEAGVTSAWRTLNMNSPRGTYVFREFPMPVDYPDYPRHEQVQAYLERAVDWYGLRPHLRLGCAVARVEPAQGGWAVTLGDGVAQQYDAVVVANGHHNDPIWPSFPGSFDGEVIHSQDYRYRERYAGKRVAVVGFGNSGAQIAVDVSFAAAETLLSIRRGGWLLPHYLFGLPIHKVLSAELNRWLNRLVPWPLTGWMLTATYRALLGFPERFGLPRPDHHFTATQITISENLLDRIGDGRVRVMPNIASLDGGRVVFIDGRSEPVDAIIYCTGYRTTFPFLDPAIFAAPENRVQLYQHIFHPERPGLCFVGVFQAVAWGFLPLYEAQGRLVAAHLAGRYALPELAAMERTIARTTALNARRFLNSPRSNYMLNGPLYLDACRAELAQGRRRAAADNHSQPPQAAP